MFAGPDGAALGGSKDSCRITSYGWRGTAYRFAECQNSDSFRPSSGARPAGS